MKGRAAKIQQNKAEQGKKISANLKMFFLIVLNFVGGKTL